MSDIESFLTYLKKIKNNNNSALIESITNNFKKISNYKSINENNESSPTQNELKNKIKESLAGNEHKEKNNQISNENNSIASNLSNLCNDALKLYKNLTGDDYINSNKTNSNNNEKNTKQDNTNVNSDSEDKRSNSQSINEPMLEEINFNNKKATGDYTGTDYTAAFDNLFNYINKVETENMQMYKMNQVEEQDQIIKNTLPLIEKILNTYKAEFQQLETERMNNLIPSIRISIANVVIGWIRILRKFDFEINQQHAFKDYYGRYIIVKFINTVYVPATDYTNMIKEQSKVVDNKLLVNIDAIMKKISALMGLFEKAITEDIKLKSNGISYTKQTNLSQHQMNV